MSFKSLLVPLVFVVVALAGHSHAHFFNAIPKMRFFGGAKPAPVLVQPDFVAGVNATVNAVLAAASNASNALPIWDLMPINAKFMLLNQTLVQKDWSVSAYILTNPNSQLTWAELPAAVRDSLYIQKRNTSNYLNQTFAAWNFVSPSDARANQTIWSYLNSICQPLALNATTALDRVQFNTTVDIARLQQQFGAIPAAYMGVGKGAGFGGDFLGFGCVPWRRVGHKRVLSYLENPRYVSRYGQVPGQIFLPLGGLLDTCNRGF